MNMNKRIIVLIALVVAVSAVPASAETLEVRGVITELGPSNPTIAASVSTPLYVADVYADGTNVPGFQWDYSSFAGFWYDLDNDLQTEHLTILAVPPVPGNPLAYPSKREIAEGGLVYTTHPVFHEYEMHQDIEPDPARGQTNMEVTYDQFFERGPGTTGLCVESGNAGGDCGYFLEGWMGKKYVAIDNNADELCKLLVEFEDDDKKTLSTGEEWALGEGFALTANQIIGEDTAEFTLSKNGMELDNKNVSAGGVYTYTTDLAGEYDVPVFSCYVDAVLRGGDYDVVQLQYVFLIDDNVLEIETSQTYGAMEVMTASSSAVVLKNDATTIDLDIDNTEHIMGDMYFKTADDDVNDHIRFYPMVEYTEPDTDTDDDGVPDVWDADNSTTPGYWVNSDGIGRRWGDMNGDGKLTSVDALIILQAAVGGASAQSIAIKAGDGSDLPDSILVGETFTVLITDDGSPVGTGTIVIFTLPQDTGDPVLVQTDGSGKVNYMPLNIGTLGIRVLDGTVTVAEATVEVI